MMLSVANADNIPPVTVSNFKYDNAFYTAVQVNPKFLSLHWQDSNGKPYKSFRTLDSSLKSTGKDVLMIMNAGIYSDNKTPAGLHIENGVELSSLNLSKGKGNFHLQPNGVFFVDKQNQAHIVSSQDFTKVTVSKVKLATQSGPMLIIDGKINPIFIKNIVSDYHRNGVCVTKSGQLFFWITDFSQGSRVNFYRFAKAGQQLGCYQALYLDGSISKNYVKNENSLFHFFEFVGLFAVTIDK